MITEVEGNILEAKEQIIGHKVNAQGIMGSGLAKQIREAYPIVFERYHELCSVSNPHQLMGYCQIVGVAEGKQVANLFGQLNYGRLKLRYTDYDSLRNALQILKNHAQLRDLTVALPVNLGCGLANGDWDVVKKMIEEIFHDYDITLYRFTK